jgi:hypothetical protein
VRVIAINDGIRLTKDFADLMYGSDVRFWNHHKGYPDYTGPKYAVEVGRGAKRSNYGQLLGVQLFRNAGDYGLTLEPDAVMTGKNSGAAAVNLAVHLGASRILLLGYDLGPDPRGRLHFCETPSPLEELSRQSEWWKFIHAFEVMVEPLKKAGVGVINCTPGSRLTCFPSQPLREALPETSVVAQTVQEAVA